MEQTVLVCGGRRYTKLKRLIEVLNLAHAANPIKLLIHGAATGADTLASAWALGAGVRQRCFEADWYAHGPAAGPIRNQQMLDEGKPDIVIAFPGGRGTADMVRRAKEAGVPVAIIDTREPG